MPKENRERGDLDVAQHHHCQGIKLGAGKSIGVPSIRHRKRRQSGERTPRKSVRDFCPAVEGRLPAALLRLARHLRTRGLFERLRAVTGKAAHAGKPLRLPSNGCVVNENGAAAKGAAVVYNNEKMQWCRRALAPQCRPTRGRTNDQAHRAAVG